MQKDITAGWRQFTNECNKDPGYPHSWAAGLERSRLENEWRQECPGLEFPEVLFSHASGQYELTGLSVTKN